MGDTELSRFLSPFFFVGLSDSSKKKHTTIYWENLLSFLFRTGSKVELFYGTLYYISSLMIIAM